MTLKELIKELENIEEDYDKDDLEVGISCKTTKDITQIKEVIYDEELVGVFIREE